MGLLLNSYSGLITFGAWARSILLLLSPYDCHVGPICQTKWSHKWPPMRSPFFISSFSFPKLDILGSDPLDWDDDDRVFIPLTSLLKFHRGTNQVDPEFRIPTTTFFDRWPLLFFFVYLTLRFIYFPFFFIIIFNITCSSLKK
jgi:hypothetical protein